MQIAFLFCKMFLSIMETDAVMNENILKIIHLFYIVYFSDLKRENLTENGC